jgi:hypothetical protein
VWLVNNLILRAAQRANRWAGVALGGIPQPLRDGSTSASIAVAEWVSPLAREFICPAHPNRAPAGFFSRRRAVADSTAPLDVLSLSPGTRRHRRPGDPRPAQVPRVSALGFSPIWFGILYTITCQIAYITPPFGYNLFLMRAMAPKEIGLRDIYVSIVPFVLIMFVTLVLIMVFPQLALWLPEKFLTK